VDASKVTAIWTTPSYHDYHWVLHPTVRSRRGAPFVDRIRDAFLRLDESNPEHKAILDLFSAKKFIPTQASNYEQIERVGREIGMIVNPK